MCVKRPDMFPRMDRNDILEKYDIKISKKERKDKKK